VIPFEVIWRHSRQSICQSFFAREFLMWFKSIQAKQVDLVRSLLFTWGRLGASLREGGLKCKSDRGNCQGFCKEDTLQAILNQDKKITAILLNILRGYKITLSSKYQAIHCNPRRYKNHLVSFICYDAPLPSLDKVFCFVKVFMLFHVGSVIWIKNCFLHNFQFFCLISMYPN